MKARVLIIDDVHESLFPYLEKAGLNYIYAPDCTVEEIPNLIKGMEGLVVRSKCRIDGEVINAAYSLKWVARAGAGTDNIDEVICASKGVTLLHAGEGNRDAVAEHTIGMMLALLNNIVRADAEVRKKIWHREANRGKELSACTVGIVGYGNTGRALARRLRAFGCRILTYDKYRTVTPDSMVEAATMEQLFLHADIVSLHIPLTNETLGLVNDNWINSFSKPFRLLNMSRGPIVSLDSINRALEQQKLISFATDVLENEKLDSIDKKQEMAFLQLIQRPEVILTPHVGGWSTESYKKISLVLGRKILSFYSHLGTK